MKTLKNVLLFKKNELLNTYRKDFETSQLLSKIEDETNSGCSTPEEDQGASGMKLRDWEIFTNPDHKKF